MTTINNIGAVASRLYEAEVSGGFCRNGGCGAMRSGVFSRIFPKSANHSGEYSDPVLTRENPLCRRQHAGAIS